MLKSIVILPADGSANRWLTMCAEYCMLRRYEVVAIVHAWVDAMKLVEDGRASVLVTARRDHLFSRETQLEVVSEQTTPVSPTRRRPKRRMVRRQVE